MPGRADPSRRRVARNQAGQCRCPHQQSLLDDQHEGGGNDVARVTARWVVQRLHQHLDRALCRQCKLDGGTVFAIAARSIGDIGIGGALEDPLQGAVEDDKVGGVDIGGHPSGIAFEDLAFSVGWDFNDPKNLAREERLLRHVEGARTATDMASSASRVWIRRRLNAERSSSTTAIGILRTSCPR
jgi:hypothetical protein